VYRDAIEVPRHGAVYRVLSSDGKLQQGLSPSLVIFDELHVQPNDDLFDALTLGSGARLDPLVVAITTAGFDLDSLAGRLYNYGKSVAANEIQDDSFGFYWWEAKPECDINNKVEWRKANPNLALGLLDAEDMEVSAKQTSEMAFRRFRLNQWVRTQESWLPVGAWEQCIGDATINTTDDAWVGIDMAMKYDSIAVVIAQTQSDGRIVVDAKIWHPDQGDMSVADVEQHLRTLHRTYNVKEFAYDPAYFQRSAEALFDEGLPMLEFPQSSQRMIPACGTAYDLIVTNKVVHDGAPMFTDQVLSAAQRMTESGWRLSKGKSRRKIDAAIAMCMALDRATREQLARQRLVLCRYGDDMALRDLFTRKEERALPTNIDPYQITARPLFSNYTGEVINEANVFASSAMIASVTLLADSVATMPLELMRDTGGRWERLPTPDVLRRPNDEQLMFDFVHQTVVTLAIHGVDFMYAPTDRTGMP
jgi:phage terminase large subunit-like protein